MPHRVRRELIWLAVLIPLGFLALPAAIYLVGVELLGDYRPDGGMGRFYSDLYAALGAGDPWAWLLLSGPWLGVTALRLLWRPLRSGRDHEAAAEEA
jgi:hypothetical protein